MENIGIGDDDAVLSGHPQTVNSGIFGSFESDGDLKSPPALPPFLPGAELNNYGDALLPSAVGSQLPGFALSNFRGKNENGALTCMAVGCEKNAQAKTNFNDAGGFCRAHFNSWLIGTGQIDSWDCECGNKISMESDRCGICHRWKNKMPTYNTNAISGVNTLLSACASATRNNGSGLMNMPANSGLQISTIRETNEYGRTLCRIIGCRELDQSMNEGFCMNHFAMFSTPIINDSNDGNCDSWTCVCGQLMSGKKKRCGKCHKWRGGKREPYTTVTKKPRVSNDNNNNDNAGHWTCDCGNQVSSAKSRCGSCHHWRGGKRKGGWKIKSSPKNGGDDGINWTQDWSCCEVVIQAKKKRCGKCHKWRGGKRFSTASSGSGTNCKDKYAMTEFI